MLLQAVALRYTSIIRGRLRMHGGVDHGGVYALLGTAGPRRPNIATGAQAIVRYPRAAASSSVRRLAPDGRRERPERRFEECDVIAIGDGCYLDSTFFTGANDPVEPECRPAPPAGRKLSSQKGQTAAAVLCASEPASTSLKNPHNVETLPACRSLLLPSGKAVTAAATRAADQSQTHRH